MSEIDSTVTVQDEGLGSAWLMVLLGGIVSVLLGLVLITWPGATIAVVGVITAIWLIAIGLVTIVGGFSRALTGGTRALMFIAGALVLLTGLVMIRGAFDLVVVLAIFLGIGLLLRGLTLFVRAGEERKRRGWLIFGGVVFVLLGIVVFVWPALSLATFVWIAGVVLIVTGIIEIIGAFYVKHDTGA